MASQAFAEKMRFFDQVDTLCASDSDSDVSRDEAEEQHRKKCRGFFESSKMPKPVSRPGTIPGKVHDSLRPPIRTRSAPSPVVTAPHMKVIEGTPVPRKDKQNTKRVSEASSIEDSIIPDSTKVARSAVQRRSTHPLAQTMPAEHSPSVSTSAARKRKRNSLPSPKAVPESAQVLRNLSFYYIPNNDVAPARKIRIGKAQEYGAKWVRSLEGATHAIVDKNLTYKDVEKLLQTAAPSLILVNEDYPIDSISFRTLLNPHQQRYRVTGCPVVKEPPTPASDEVELSRDVIGSSLPVNDSRRESKRARKTPRSGDSTPGSGDKAPRSPQLPETSREDRSSPNRHLESSGYEPLCSPAETGRPTVEVPLPKDNINDELTEYISLLQEYKDLPLDEDDDEPQSPHDSSGSVSDSDSGPGPKTGSRSSRRGSGGRKGTAGSKKVIPFAEHFACNRGGTKDKSADATNPNARTIEVLQSMCDYYTRIDDHWRIMAYRKAISTLRRQTVKITTEEEAYRLPTIGPQLAKKIEEIVQTDRLRRLEYAQKEPLDRVLETFIKIYDVGTSRAGKWIAQGHRTLDDLVQKADLTVNQRLGIEHYDDFNTRIPRAEVTALGDYIRAAAAEIDPQVELLTGGSYRRGSESSGDIDIIVTRRGTSSTTELVPFLDELVAVLTQRGFLVATLVSLHGRHHAAGHASSKWHGCCVLPRERSPSGGSAETAPGGRPIWRRIDFLLVPETEFGAALIYFTGNDIFNRSMRLLAARKGMRLNQRGLYKNVMRGPGRAKVSEGELVEGRDEKRIFEILGVKWREPRERWC